MSDEWFAQRGEDRALRRLLGERDPIRWIDVGAYDPVVDSVTEHFSRRGGTGINLEPVPTLFAAFPAARPRDVNLDCGVSDYRGHATITEIVGTGLSTFHNVNAARGRAHPLARGHNRIRVEVRTLADICLQYLALDEPIDFLKIDVEGLEREVLAGANFRLFRPTYIVIEATHPCTEIPSYAEWEPDLLAAGYGFIEADGLNRFYQAR